MLGYIQIYSPKAKNTIRDILERNLGRYQVEKYTDNILTCVDELIKNAVKANYKYVLIREKIEEYLAAHPEDKTTAEEIMRDRNLYNDYAERVIDMPAVQKIVRLALTEESKVISLKTKAIRDGRKYTPEEVTTIMAAQNLIGIHKRIQKYHTRVQLRVNEVWNYLNIEIMNNAPILRRDIERIHKKRVEFQSYHERGQEMMFFIENMDDADGGAGLGYATIDSCLIELGLDPFKTISIISVSNTTVMLNLELKVLREVAARPE